MQPLSSQHCTMVSSMLMPLLIRLLSLVAFQHPSCQLVLLLPPLAATHRSVANANVVTAG